MAKQGDEMYNKRIFSTKHGAYFWTLAVGIGGIILSYMVISLITGWLWYLAALLVFGYGTLLYIGSTNGVDVYQNNRELIFIRTIDCRREEATVVDIDKLSEVKYDDECDMAYLDNGNNDYIHLGLSRNQIRRLLRKTAQQVDSAEASTIAVPPSEPPGSPR